MEEKWSLGTTSEGERLDTKYTLPVKFKLQ